MECPLPHDQILERVCTNMRRLFVARGGSPDRPWIHCGQKNGCSTLMAIIGKTTAGECLLVVVGGGPEGKLPSETDMILDRLVFGILRSDPSLAVGEAPEHENCARCGAGSTPSAKGNWFRLRLCRRHPRLCSRCVEGDGFGKPWEMTCCSDCKRESTSLLDVLGVKTVVLAWRVDTGVERSNTAAVAEAAARDMLLRSGGGPDKEAFTFFDWRKAAVNPVAHCVTPPHRRLQTASQPSLNIPALRKWYKSNPSVSVSSFSGLV